MNMKVKWGFVGTGRIIPRFMTGICAVEDAIPAAIYGRNPDKVNALADRYGIPDRYYDFDTFLKEADIDIAYIALPHPMHERFTEKCLKAKIPVLCEKPMAPNAAQETRMIQCAKENDTFLMEAMWTHYFPAIRQVKQWIMEGRIGKVIALNCTYSFIAPPENDTDRLFRLEDAGGALLDIGIYNVAFAEMVFGRQPEEIRALADIATKTGHDRTEGYVFKYDRGEIATLLCSFGFAGKDIATIYGSKGMIEIYEDFWRPRRMRMSCIDGVFDYEASEDHFSGEGYQFEIEHVHRCLADGLKESPEATFEKSLANIQVCDEIRKQIGLYYPFDEASDRGEDDE